MDDQSLLRLFDDRARRQAPPDSPAHRVEHAADHVRQTGPDADSWNAVVWSRLDAAGADAAIARQIAHYTRLGLPFEWKLYSHDTPADLGERLTAAGFAAGEPEALMVAESAAQHEAPALPGGITLRDATDEHGLDLAAEVHAQVFGTAGGNWIPSVRASLAAGEDVHRITLAMDGDRPVSAARLELTPGSPFAGLWGGGTLPAYRRRGIYRALVAHRARHATALGHPYLQVDASPHSRSVLTRLGFRALATTTPYVYDPRARL